MASEYTPNYNLDLYVSGDAPNLRDQYNAAMSKVDAQLKTLADGDVVINNMIAGINRDIAAINTAQNKLVDDVTALQTLTSSQGSAIEQDAQRITTLEAYFAGLGIENIDEAQDLLADINDAHTTAMTNQADIAVMKPQVAGLQTSVSGLETNVGGMSTSISALRADVDDLKAQMVTVGEDLQILSQDWSISTFDTKYENETYNGMSVFVNAKKTLFKLAGRVDFSAGTLTLVQIPGTSLYGGKLVDLGYIFGKPETAITYSRVLTQTFNASTGYSVERFWYLDMIIGIDGFAYVSLQDNSRYPQGDNTTSRILCNQIMLTTNNYHITPIDPDEL